MILNVRLWAVILIDEVEVPSNSYLSNPKSGVYRGTLCFAYLICSKTHTGVVCCCCLFFLFVCFLLLFFLGGGGGRTQLGQVRNVVETNRLSKWSVRRNSLGVLDVILHKSGVCCPCLGFLHLDKILQLPGKSTTVRTYINI